ncbi:MAG: hypothetical protein DMF56_15400 [Acidobacteria bacterium]|nr:MAG: hypothetical protein DMF56_15400 [Acidobacteriota bacterium]
MREQVRLTAQIHAHLLPRANPSIEGYEVAGHSVAAQDMGGDYFDYNALPNGAWSISVGDVSGKGLPASLLMANVQGVIRLLSSLNVPPAEVMSRANALLCRSTPQEKFVTFFYSTLDPSSHALTFCNAGHTPTFHFHRDGIARLVTGGAVLGMLETFAYRQDSVTLDRGDVVVIYSDGVTDAMDADEREFGEQRLLDVVDGRRDESASSILDTLLEAVRHHQHQQPQYDDITAVVLKRT